MPDISNPSFSSLSECHCRTPSGTSATAALFLTTLLYLLPCLPAAAQQPLPDDTTHRSGASVQAEGKTLRPEPKVEYLHHEDTGSRMEELRVEGRSKSVRVQPKSVRIAPYEVNTRPENGSLIHQDSNPSGKTNRSWRLLQF